MLNKLKNRKQEGFTIIEVLIVLAIAGLIILIVLLAVPALQRNGRNTATKNDASSLAGGIGEYKSNNDGGNPTTITGTGTVTISGAAGSISATAKLQGSVAPVSGTVATAANTVVYHLGFKCDGSASPRSTAVFYWTEQASGGNGQKCVEA
ncbi:MAG TPA: type II secretion system protein [Candidatus Microsaccharimonas sp.]|nr:type II secretion system protein [Candidatus Microsaccharimonas sp.]